MNKKLKIILITLTILSSLVLGFLIGVRYTIKNQQIAINTNTLETESIYWFFGWRCDSYQGTNMNNIY